MRIRPVMLLVAVLAATGAIAAPHRPTAPHQAVEVNALDAPCPTCGLFDPPTPFPGPTPPKPRPTEPTWSDVDIRGLELATLTEPATLSLFATLGTPGDVDPMGVTAAEAIYAYAKGATWYTRRASDGALVFHDCGDPTRLTVQLASAPAGRIEAVEYLAETKSAEMATALMRWRRLFEAATAPGTSPSDVNDLWWAFVSDNSESIAAGAVELPAIVRVESTTGRCDGCTTEACCPSKHTCDCQMYDSVLGDCVTTRMTCNTDTPPERSRTLMTRWTY